MGPETCSDSVFLNASVLSFLSTLAIQNSKKNTVRKIRIFLTMKKVHFFALWIVGLLFSKELEQLKIYLIFLYSVPETLVQKLLVKNLLLSQFTMTQSLVTPKC